MKTVTHHSKVVALPKLTPIPTSRRFIKDEFHAYGWKVAFMQTCIHPNGVKERIFFSSLGTNRANAIGHAMGRLYINVNKPLHAHVIKKN
jgi:hypothetical protein